MGRVSWGMHRKYEYVSIKKQGDTRNTLVDVASDILMLIRPYRGTENPEFIDRENSAPIYRAKVQSPNANIKKRHIVIRGKRDNQGNIIGNGDEFVVTDVENAVVYDPSQSNNLRIVEQTLTMELRPK